MFGFVHIKLKDIASYSSSKISAESVNKSNYVGVDNLLQDKLGKSDSSFVPESGRLTEFKSGNILIGNIRPYLKKIWFSDRSGGTNGDVLVVQPNKDIVLEKYLYYILSSDKFFAYDMQFAKGAKMPRGDKNAIMEYEISLPEIKEQERIIEILNKFETICNDLSNGLPAEIEARQKQYEYYRDKLLTFKEV